MTSKTDKIIGECDHKGQWRGLGVTAMGTPGGTILIHNLFCKGCGITKTNTIAIPSKPPSPISVPKVILKNRPH